MALGATLARPLGFASVLRTAGRAASAPSRWTRHRLGRFASSDSADCPVFGLGSRQGRPGGSLTGLPRPPSRAERRQEPVCRPDVTSLLEGLAPISGLHGGPEERQGRHATRRTPDARTRAEPARGQHRQQRDKARRAALAAPERIDLEPTRSQGQEDQRSGPQDASTGSANRPGEGSNGRETRSAAHAPGEQRTRRPRHRDQAKSRTGCRADRHRQERPAAAGVAQIAEGQPAAAEPPADRPVRLPARTGRPSEQKRAVRRALAAKGHGHGPFMTQQPGNIPNCFYGCH